MHNDIDKINNIIGDIRDYISEYNLKAMFTNIDSLILEISDRIDLDGISKEKIGILNTILQNINTSIQNKDYQLTSDILKFQLKDFLDNI